MKKGYLNILLAAMVAATGFMSSCNTRNTNYQALVDTTWILEEVVAEDGGAYVPVPAQITITFADSSKRVFGNAGCNNINGMYEVAGHDQIGISRVASTMMWCQNMEFEDMYTAMLEKVVTYEATHERLVLEGTAQSRMRLVYRNGGQAEIE